MHGGRCPGHSRCLTQEGSLFPIAYTEMNCSPGVARQGTGNHDTRKTAPRAKVNPCSRLRGQGEELQRISDVARPDFAKRRRRDQIESTLPEQQHFDESVETFLGFT